MSEPLLFEEFVEPGFVRFVYRHLAFLGPESLRAAEASECAGDQGSFWEYHDTLFMNWAGENVGAYSDANLVRFASEIGLDAIAFRSCLNSGQYRQKVEDDVQAARDLGVTSTPTLFINGVRVERLRSYEEYRLMIMEELTTGG